MPKLVYWFCHHNVSSPVKLPNLNKNTKLEIIAKKPENTVWLNDHKLTGDKSYGVIYQTGISSNKGFLTAKNYGSEEYHFLSTTELAKGNRLFYHGILENVIKEALEHGCRIFVFDTAKELMAWLSEDIK